MDGKSMKGIVKDCKPGPAGSKLAPRVHRTHYRLMKSSPSQVTEDTVKK